MKCAALFLACLLAAAAAQTYDHVVVTTDSFVSRLAPLCNWVEVNLGLNDTTATVEAICAQFPGRDRPEKIRNFIRDAYEQWGTTHVLLGGDVEVVPCRRAWVNAENRHPLLKDSIACDLYYADLDGDWDLDHDGLFGEPEDSVDFYPDVFVGRLPATAAATVDVIVGKLLTYLGNSNADYLRNVLLSGFDIFDGVFCETTMEFYDTAYVPQPMRPCNRVYDSHTGNHRSAVLAALNEGQHVWVHADHCSYSAMGMGWMNHEWTVTREVLGQLANSGRYTIMTSLGCQTGMFNVSDCCAEHFMMAPNGGGVATASNSQYGVGDRNNPQRAYSMMLVEGFVCALFERTGHGSLEAIAAAWAGAAPYADTDLVYRWCLYCWNLLGESAMPVWVPASSWVEERSTPHAPRTAPMPTIIRGVLLLPASLAPSPASLLDASGRRVMTLRPGPNDISRLVPGVYFITRDGTSTGRVVVLAKE